MPAPLFHVPFTPALLGRASVQGFDCGPADWEREITAWLKQPPGQPGACEEAAAGNDVWLYVTGTGDLVGVGALGPSAASYPKNSSARQPATCITYLGVNLQYRGQGYGKVVLEHLLSVAQVRAAAFPLVTLYVHTGNTVAVGWYGRYGFAPSARQRSSTCSPANG